MKNEGIITLDVFGCARCGKDHKAMAFYEFDEDEPEFGYTDVWTHASVCPETGETVLMRFINDSTETKTI